MARYPDRNRIQPRLKPCLSAVEVNKLKGKLSDMPQYSSWHAADGYREQVSPVPVLALCFGDLHYGRSETHQHHIAQTFPIDIQYFFNLYILQ